MDYEQNPKLQRMLEAFRKEAVPLASMISTPLLPLEAVQRAAWHFGVFPSKGQILELHMALGSSDQCRGLQFYEFCLLITFLQTLKRRNPKHQRHPVRKLEKQSWDVFLGGACNPTTWRSDVAIPFCEKEKISYFNPQVADWSPDLVEAEAIAKDTSLINLFVLDERVRGTSTMVEMGYLSGAGYNMLPVMPRLKATKRSVGANDECLSDEEEACLRRAMLTLNDLLDRRGYPVFSDLSAALRCALQIISQPERRSVFELTQADGAVPVFDADYDVGVLGAHLLATFLSHAVYGSDKVTAAQVESILSETVGRTPPLKETANGYQFSFREVALLVSAHADPGWPPVCPHGPANSSSSSGGVGRLLMWLARVNRCLLRVAHRLAGLLSKPPSPQPLGRVPFDWQQRRHYDVFLGGTCGESTWREDVVIPRLQAAGASFYNPQAAPWHLGLQPGEARARELSRVLLFVITRDTLSTAGLVEAAHFIGRGAAVVLYVAELPTAPAVAAQELAVGFPLSSEALKDYARARHYLEDVAVRCGVPLQPSVEACAERVVALLQPPPA